MIKPLMGSVILLLLAAWTSAGAHGRAGQTEAAETGDRRVLSVLVFDHDLTPEASVGLRRMLQESGYFLAKTGDSGQSAGDEATPPEFSQYDLVIVCGRALDFSDSTRKSLLKYVAGGGGLVAIHDAGAAMPDWPAYHRMLGVGLWNSETSASYRQVYWDNEQQKLQRDQVGPPLHPDDAQARPVLLEVRATDHPITAGLPEKFWQTDDHLLTDLRGPAENLHVLATARDASTRGPQRQHPGPQRQHPVLMTTRFAQGRVFQTTLGQNAQAMRGAAFQVTLLRGAEWAATGKVTMSPVGSDVLSAEVPLVNADDQPSEQTQSSASAPPTDQREPDGEPVPGEPAQPTGEPNPPAGKKAGSAADEDDVAIPDVDADDWKPLFDGKTLDGWTQKNGTGTFRVEEGLVVGKTAKGSPNSFLCTTKNYADFELTFEVNVDLGLNSGVQIRSHSKPDFKDGRVHGTQIEIESSPGNSGYLYSEATGRSWISKEQPIQDAYQNGQWNRFVVRANGDRLQTWLNGKQIADVVDSQSAKDGFIGLQVHSIEKDEGPYEVRWRDVRIRELGQSPSP